MSATESRCQTHQQLSSMLLCISKWGNVAETLKAGWCGLGRINVTEDPGLIWIFLKSLQHVSWVTLKTAGLFAWFVVFPLWWGVKQQETRSPKGMMNPPSEPISYKYVSLLCASASGHSVHVRTAGSKRKCRISASIWCMISPIHILIEFVINHMCYICVSKAHRHHDSGLCSCVSRREMAGDGDVLILIYLYSPDLCSVSVIHTENHIITVTSEMQSLETMKWVGGHHGKIMRFKNAYAALGLAKCVSLQGAKRKHHLKGKDSLQACLEKC